MGCILSNLICIGRKRRDKPQIFSETLSQKQTDGRTTDEMIQNYEVGGAWWPEMCF